MPSDTRNRGDGSFFSALAAFDSSVRPLRWPVPLTQGVALGRFVWAHSGRGNREVSGIRFLGIRGHQAPPHRPPADSRPFRSRAMDPACGQVCCRTDFNPFCRSGMNSALRRNKPKRRAMDNTRMNHPLPPQPDVRMRGFASANRRENSPAVD